MCFHDTIYVLQLTTRKPMTEDSLLLNNQETDRPTFDTDVQARLKLWCKKLIDLSNRNPLIKFNDTSQNVLKIIDEKPIEIYRLLVEENNQLGFLPKDFDTREEFRAFEKYDRNELEQKHVDLFLQTKLEEKSLNYKLRKLSGLAQSSLEEYGYNSLYIALGSVFWTEIEYSEKKIESPLLLVPVQLVKDSSKNTYKVSYTNEPCILNPALILKLKNDFDIDMSSLDIADEELNPMEVFDRVKNFISVKQNWILSENIFLAILNFENLVIYKDLETNEDEICRNFLVKTICGKDSLNEGTADEIAPMEEYDEKVRPLDNYQIYSADSSQQQAIEVAKKNHNLIIEGPPGTGKSQTITNIIAELLAQGKKVLFVSQKQAALEVVYNKLKEAGLSEFCLSLHKNTNKSETMSDLANCLNKDEQKLYANEEHLDKIQTLKSQLNNYVKESNTKCGKLNKTPFEAIEVVSKNDDITDIGYVFKNIADWDSAKFNTIKTVLGNYVESIGYLNCNPKHHSWYGSNIREVPYSVKNTFNTELGNLKLVYENLKSCCLELSTALVIDEPKTISDINVMCMYADVISRYSLHILEENLDELISKFSMYSQKLSARLSIFQYMQDCKLLSKYTLGNEKVELQQAVQDLTVLKEIKEKNFSNYDINQNSTYQLMNRTKKLLGDTVKSVQSITDLLDINLEITFNTTFENIELYKIINKFECMQHDIDDLANWFNYLNAFDKVKENDFDDFCTLCNNLEINKDDIVRTFETQFYRLWLYEVVFPQRPELSNFSREQQESKIEEFHKLDLSQIEIAKVRLKYMLSLQTDVNTDTETSSKTSEIGILKQEAKKTRRQCTLRKLFKNIPNILLKLKPCVMMSPVNVSKLLSNTEIKFDTVIFDEASQLPTEECIASIIRGKNIVVAGDSKQLPPTSFFKKTYAGIDEDEENVDFDEIKREDMESLLDQCTIANFPQCPLKWHYRSKHEHLIAFSNIYMYNNKLYTFPSNKENDGEEYGIQLVPVTSYENDITDKRMDEARQIAKAVIEHAKNHSDRSLGVVAFNINQVRRIEDMLEEEKERNPEVKSFFDKNRVEPFFIKSIENVQGDERDVIYISVGTFKNTNGSIDMRTFSILNQDGGERRLNVLVTRAKKLIKVFSAVTDGDFGNVENFGKGVRLLKYYLDFAIRKEDAIKSATMENANAETESPFEDSVLRVLQAHGYEVKPQVGCANYRIDLAIVDKENPGKYILAVECDGASYHSSVTARDRDWLRQKCLQDLGWKIYRIWSTDWFKNRSREIEKLIKAVQEAETNKNVVKKN